MARRLKEGSILILTVWILFFLAALAVAVGSYVSAGLVIARKAGMDAYGRTAMKAGVEHVIAVLEADTNDWDGFAEDWGSNGGIDWEEQELSESVYSIYHVSAGGTTNAGVIDEESRININKADRKLLEAAFRVIGRADAMQASSLAAAIIDWRDSDEEVTQGGAESGFYGGLQPGYGCPNEDFRSIYELMLVRGMTQEMFDKMSGVLTVYGIGKINLNTAEREVIITAVIAAGADDISAAGLADRIIAFRQAGGGFSESNAMGIIAAVKGGGLLSAGEETALMGLMMTATLKGSCFRGISAGRWNLAETAASVEFVYSRDQHRILFWKEK